MAINAPLVVFRKATKASGEQKKPVAAKKRTMVRKPRLGFRRQRKLAGPSGSGPSEGSLAWRFHSGAHRAWQAADLASVVDPIAKEKDPRSLSMFTFRQRAAPRGR